MVSHQRKAAQVHFPGGNVFGSCVYPARNKVLHSKLHVGSNGSFHSQIESLTIEWHTELLTYQRLFRQIPPLQFWSLYFSIMRKCYVNALNDSIAKL